MRFVGNRDRVRRLRDPDSSPNGDSVRTAWRHHGARDGGGYFDPDLNAWYDSSGAENVTSALEVRTPPARSQPAYNQTFVDIMADPNELGERRGVAATRPRVEVL